MEVSGTSKDAYFKWLGDIRRGSIPMTAAHATICEGYRTNRRASSRVRSSGPSFGGNNRGQAANEKLATAKRFSIAKGRERELAMLDDSAAA